MATEVGVKGLQEILGGTVSPFKNGENFQGTHVFFGGRKFKATISIISRLRNC